MSKRPMIVLLLFMGASGFFGAGLGYRQGKRDTERWYAQHQRIAINAEIVKTDKECAKGLDTSKPCMSTDGTTCILPPGEVNSEDIAEYCQRRNDSGVQRIENYEFLEEQL